MFIHYPFPLYATFVQMALSIIPSFFMALISNHCDWSMKWIIPPFEAMPRLVLSAFFYGAYMLSGNYGFYVSDLDFAVLFRLSVIVSSSLCGLIFLGERLSIWSTLCIILVIAGLICLTSNFQWSTAKMPSTFQLIVQFAAIFSSSFTSVMLKLTMQTMEDLGVHPDQMTLLFWRYVLGCFPVLISAIIVEPNVVSNYQYVTDLPFLYWTMLGILLSGIYQIVNNVLHKITALVTLTIVAQMKFLPTLIISHFIYNETQWTKQQIIGASLLIVGGIVYSCTRMECKNEKTDSIDQPLNSDDNN